VSVRETAAPAESAAWQAQQAAVEKVIAQCGQDLHHTEMAIAHEGTVLPQTFSVAEEAVA
jgi:hypothetical protein